MITYTLNVVKIRKETEDTITLCFKQPGLRKIKYEAGQYLTLIFRINGRRYIRPYSFSSAPIFDSYLEVTIKRVQHGIVSNHIHDIVKEGDTIEVMSPMGDFTFNKDVSSNHAFLWGVGSGITPLISLIKKMLTESSLTTVNLIYGNRNHEAIIFSDLINELLVKFSDKFKVQHFISRFSVDSDFPFAVQGRITLDSVLSVMKGIEAEKSLHYVCGPLGLKESVKVGLSRLKVPQSHIMSEDFELVKDPTAFEDINTQFVELKFNDLVYNLEVIKGQSILECALNAGIELPYSCQTGSCSTCKAKILRGGVKMIGLNSKREDLLDSEYLLCCSHPTSNNVSLEV